MLYDVLNLLYPKLCAACNNNLLKSEHVICTKCKYDIPKTNFMNDPFNPVSQIFWGRVKLVNACSYYYFFKGSIFQELIHKLKYKGQKEIGYELGKLFGFELANSPLYSDVDLLVPVPLHPKREKQRGYNQSEWIVNGLAEAMNTKKDTKNFYRNIETETQTKKSRFDRWKNVDNIFCIHNPQLFEGKHILIADDVITTGSTFEACANALLAIKDVRVSVVALASASNL
jgi:ComF family protein